MKKQRGNILIIMMPIIALLSMAIGIYVYNAESSTVNITVSKMDKKEKELYNSSIEKYTSQQQEGSKVILLIDEIISKNKEYIDEENFISIETENITNFDSKNLEKVCKTAYQDNSSENVKLAEKEMKNLKEKINMTKTYKIETEKEDGLISKVKITENTQIYQTPETQLDNSIDINNTIN